MPKGYMGQENAKAFDAELSQNLSDFVDGRGFLSFQLEARITSGKPVKRTKHSTELSFPDLPRKTEVRSAICRLNRKATPAPPVVSTFYTGIYHLR